MTEQEKEFVKELIEDLISAATDYGIAYEAGGVTDEGFKIAEQNLARNSEKLYSWLDKQ